MCPSNSRTSNYSVLGTKEVFSHPDKWTLWDIFYHYNGFILGRKNEKQQQEKKATIVFEMIMIIINANIKKEKGSINNLIEEKEIIMLCDT